MSHHEKLQRAKDAIGEVFSDTGVDLEAVRESLEELRELVEEDLKWSAI